MSWIIRADAKVIPTEEDFQPLEYTDRIYTDERFETDENDEFSYDEGGTWHTYAKGENALTKGFTWDVDVAISPTRYQISNSSTIIKLTLFNPDGSKKGKFTVKRLTNDGWVTE